MSDPIVEAAAWLQSDAARLEIDALCETFEIDLMTLFGSAADPSVDHPGDIDVGVVGSTSDVDVLGLIDAMTVLTGCETIDIAVLNRARPVIRAQALCGIGIYERRSGVLARAQMPALGEARDTAWLRRLDVERMAGFGS